MRRRKRNLFALLTAEAGVGQRWPLARGAAHSDAGAVRRPALRAAGCRSDEAGSDASPPGNRYKAKILYSFLSNAAYMPSRSRLSGGLLHSSRH
jgi:hypothetical protein